MATRGKQLGEHDIKAARHDGEALPLGVLDDFVGYHLRRSSTVFTTDFNRIIGEFGLRQVPFAVLTMIARYPGINQGAIGRALGIQRANMVALVGDMLEQGLVDRSDAVVDRRAFALTISEKGDGVLREALGRIEAHEKALLADFSDLERQILIALLGRIENKER